MCEGDPTSVVIQGNGQPQCLSAQMSDCRFNMHDFDQLDADLNMVGCGGTWAAPLWMTPDHWAGGGDSGEVDMLENCPSSSVDSNFAGGGTQEKWTIANPNSFQGHMTMWKQADEADSSTQSIHVKLCNPDEVQSGVCPEGVTAYLHDIYGKNGCSNGANCMYTMVSDIWNGLDGDGGYAGCAGGKTHASSGCHISITNIRVQASSGTFTGKCAALTGASPSPSPSPSPSGTCSVGDSVFCPGSSTIRCGGDQCCPDGSVCPSASPTWDSCEHPKSEDCTGEGETVIV